MTKRPRYKKGRVLMHKEFHCAESEPVKVTAVRAPNDPTSYAEGQWHYDVTGLCGSIPESNLRALTKREKGEA